MLERSAKSPLAKCMKVRGIISYAALNLITHKEYIT